MVKSYLRFAERPGKRASGVDVVMIWRTIEYRKSFNVNLPPQPVRLTFDTEPQVRP